MYQKTVESVLDHLESDIKNIVPNVLLIFFDDKGEIIMLYTENQVFFTNFLNLADETLSIQLK